MRLLRILLGAGLVFGLLGGPVWAWDVDAPTFRYNGLNSYDRFGQAVANIGDFNGDGLDDLAVGAPYWDGVFKDCGAVYIFYGTGQIPGVDPDLSAATADVVIEGWLEEERLGHSIAGLGDFNGDGYNDLAIGAPGMIWNPVRDQGGGVYIFFGGPGVSGTIFAGRTDVYIKGEAAMDMFGFSVAGGVDFNGDGLGDLAVGAPGNDSLGDMSGKAYIFHGSTGAGGVMYGFNADHQIISDDAGDLLGYSLVFLPGFGHSSTRPVLAVSGLEDEAHNWNHPWAIRAKENSGLVYIIEAGTAAEPLPANVEAVRDCTWYFYGSQSGEDFGFKLARVGDFNGGGIEDLLVGAPSAQTVAGGNPGDDGGMAYLLLGERSSVQGRLGVFPKEDENTVLLYGQNVSRAQFGWSVCGVGDINRDGLADVAVGSIGQASLPPRGAKVHVFTGFLSDPTANEPATREAGSQAYVRILGERSPEGSFAYSLAACDFNGTGFMEIVVGAKDHDGEAGGSGRVEVYSLY